MGVNGRLVFVVYRDGNLVRYNTDDPTKAYVAEQVDLIAEPGVTISAVRMLLGNLTLIVADSKGGVNGWFPAPAPDTTATKDGTRMMKAHVMEPQASPVTAIGTSARDRQFVTADATDTHRAVARCSALIVQAFAASRLQDCLTHCDALQQTGDASRLSDVYRAQVKQRMNHAPDTTFDGTLVLTSK